MDKQFINNLLK